MCETNLTLITSPCSSGDIELWASGPERLGDQDEEWGISIFGNKTEFLMTLVYAGKEAAEAALNQLPLLLTDCTFNCLHADQKQA